LLRQAATVLCDATCSKIGPPTIAMGKSPNYCPPAFRQA